MATLTPEQIDYIRLSIGDGCDKLTEAQIQAAYDRAEGDECGTNYLLSRILWTSVKPAAVQLVNGGTGFSRTLSDIYKERMDVWANCAGQGMGTITTGVIGLGIDATEDDLTDTSASWLWGW